MRPVSRFIPRRLERRLSCAARPVFERDVATRQVIEHVAQANRQGHPQRALAAEEIREIFVPEFTPTSVAGECG